jgi:arylformamidase
MSSRERHGACLAAATVVALFLAAQASFAGPIRDRIMARYAERMQQELQEDETGLGGAASLPVGVEVVRDVPYGQDERQRFDVYHTAKTRNAPVIFMVHGGGWRWGDKAMRRMVQAKLTRWVPMGFVFISTNYRMLPTDPIEQARDVARALAVAQEKASEWGADRSKFILMGHSAGAHLIMLVATSRPMAAGVAPWLGAVSLDSGALDVVEIMEGRHMRLYDNAFGRDRDFWRAASPYHVLTAGTRPVLAVCSTRRTDSCPQARRFAEKAKSLNATVTVLEKEFSHGEINARLGEDTTYTTEVERFLARLDTTVARLLGK